MNRLFLIDPQVKEVGIRLIKSKSYSVNFDYVYAIL
jgi:hypothetical protein